MTDRRPSIMDWAPGGTIARINVDAAYPWRDGSTEEDDS